MTRNISLNDPESKKPVVLGRYRVQKNRKSKYVCLPAAWVVVNGIEPGDYVEFSLEGNGTLCARKVEVGAPALKQGSEEAGVA